jgi:hypothetical protein
LTVAVVLTGSTCSIRNLLAKLPCLQRHLVKSMANSQGSRGWNVGCCSDLRMMAMVICWVKSVDLMTVFFWVISVFFVRWYARKSKTTVSTWRRDIL